MSYVKIAPELDKRKKKRALAEVPPVQIPIGVTLAEAERILIEETVKAAGGNRQYAAEVLGISGKTLWNKMHGA